MNYHRSEYEKRPAMVFPEPDCGCKTTYPACDSVQDGLTVTMAYVPWQYFCKTYDLDEALRVGTIFPELNKPFYGRGGRNR